MKLDQNTTVGLLCWRVEVTHFCCRSVGAEYGRLLIPFDIVFGRFGTKGHSEKPHFGGFVGADLVVKRLPARLNVGRRRRVADLGQNPTKQLIELMMLLENRFGLTGEDGATRYRLFQAAARFFFGKVPLELVPQIGDSRFQALEQSAICLWPFQLGNFMTDFQQKSIQPVMLMVKMFGISHAFIVGVHDQPFFRQNWPA
jgi:hypothetical protein